MRPFCQPLAILLAAIALTGCGRAASPTVAPVSGSSRLQPAAQAQAPAQRPTVSLIANNSGRIVANNGAGIIANNGAGIIANNGAGLTNALPELDLRYADSNPPASPAAEAAEDARMAAEAKAAADAPPPYNIDDRMPYGVVVVARSATTATIAWRTNVPTKGLIEFAKTRDFKGMPMLRITPKGFTDRVLDEVAKTDHKYTLTGLSRFTSYTFKVTAVTPLGLKFAEQERPFRTKFWALR